MKIIFFDPIISMWPSLNTINFHLFYKFYLGMTKTQTATVGMDLR